MGLFGLFEVFIGNQFRTAGELEHLAQDVLPVGPENIPSTNEQDIEVARKIGPEVAIGFAQATASTVALIGPQADFFTRDDPET